MAQKLHVVCCVGCKIFQVQIVKKSSNKWVCKVCETKQSVLRVFGEGTGKDCRLLVQQLNATRGQEKEGKEIETFDKVDEEDSPDEFLEEGSSTSTSGSSQQTLFASGVSVVPETESKWRKYCESEDVNEFFFE